MVLVVLGTRPEAIKLWPVVMALRARGIDVRIASTQQQPDLLPAFLDELALRVDYAWPEPRYGHPAVFLGAALTWLEQGLEQIRPRLVLVQGDTTTTLAGALAGAYAKIPVAHVEAGLRTRDLEHPFPEELHRQIIARCTRLHFAPTTSARLHLEREALDGRCTIRVPGNTVVDAARALTQRLGPLEHPADVLVTFHRREAWDRVAELAAALRELPQRVRWVLHANPAIAAAARAHGDGLELVAPLGYTAFLRELSSARLVVTDSGGVTEEAIALGVPLVIVRNATERPEALHTARLCPLDELANLGQIVADMLNAPRPPPSDAFGDGHASERIADTIVGFLQRPS